MSFVKVTKSYLDAIGDAIRAKLNVSTKYTPDQMATAIQSITAGGSANLGTKSITANGTYNASGDSLDGYSSVTVNVSGGSAILGTKSITQNGTYAASGDSLDGYSSVEVNVSGGGVTQWLSFSGYASEVTT